MPVVRLGLTSNVSTSRTRMNFVQLIVVVVVEARFVKRKDVIQVVFVVNRVKYESLYPWTSSVERQVLPVSPLAMTIVYWCTLESKRHFLLERALWRKWIRLVKPVSTNECKCPTIGISCCCGGLYYYDDSYSVMLAGSSFCDGNTISEFEDRIRLVGPQEVKCLAETNNAEDDPHPCYDLCLPRTASILRTRTNVVESSSS